MCDWICDICQVTCNSKCVFQRNIFMLDATPNQKFLNLMTTVEVKEGATSITIHHQKLEDLVHVTKIMAENPEWVKQKICSHNWKLVDRSDCQLECGEHN